MCYVYKIVDEITGSFYIGSSKDFKLRFKRHLNELKANKHHNVYMQKLYNEGASFIITAVRYESREEAYKQEFKKLEYYKNDPLLLNIVIGGRFGDFLSRHPRRDEIVAKISEAVRQRAANIPPEEREAYYAHTRGSRNGMYGRKHTKEAREKMSKAQAGKPSPFKGTKMPKDRYERFMEWIKKRDITGDKNPFYGKKHSPETLKKLSDRFKGGENPSKRRKVIIKGKIYESVGEAAKVHNLKLTTLYARCRASSLIWKDWQFYKSPESIESHPMDENG